MCNDYEQHIRYAEYCKMMQDLALGIPIHTSGEPILVTSVNGASYITDDSFVT